MKSSNRLTGLVLAAGLIVSVSNPALAQTRKFELYGYLIGRQVYVKAPPSWTQEGFGRFDVGGDSPDDRRPVTLGIVQLGAEWSPKEWLNIHADGVARTEPSGTGGRRSGLVQAYGDVFNEKWRLRAGLFWLPTSRENVDPLWNSRYTITYSALNTWVGQEVRPVGVDVQYSPNFYVTLGATAFGGNDTMGTELAARGWTLGSRLAVYNEYLPLPRPMNTTTMPIGRDLDNRWGHAERLRIQLPERAMLQLTHVDNRAELIPLIDGLVPWLTKFDVVGVTIGPMAPTTLAAEWSYGWTAVGFPGGSFTLDFDTAYVLVSHKRGASRWTLRGERFWTDDSRRRPNHSSYERGHAVTVAWLRDITPHLRAGAEFVRVTGNRRGAVLSGLDKRTGGSTVSLELRYAF